MVLANQPARGHLLGTVSRYGQAQVDIAQQSRDQQKDDQCHQHRDIYLLALAQSGMTRPGQIDVVIWDKHRRVLIVTVQYRLFCNQLAHLSIIRLGPRIQAGEQQDYRAKAPVPQV